MSEALASTHGSSVALPDAVVKAIAHQRLEGIDLSPSEIAFAVKIANGECSAEEAIAEGMSALGL